MKTAITINITEDTCILCRLFRFEIEELVQYYVNHISIETFLNSNQPDYNSATYFFIKYATEQKQWDYETHQGRIETDK